MKIDKYSFGLGDRFGHQGKAQLSAIIDAEKTGTHITPVWNKSFREHSIVGTSPGDVRHEADEAVKSLVWESSYFVDADHINMKNVDAFIPFSNFFTMDVAEAIGKPSPDRDTEDFILQNRVPSGQISLPGMKDPIPVTEDYLRHFAGHYLFAISEAERIYRHIAERKDPETFVTEVSIDEVDRPQTPADLYFILKALAEKNIPVQTIAPRFSGRFNKGVDYAGDLNRFEREFEEDLLVIAYAKEHFRLPESLKLSIHSGSDKFSIYPVIGHLISKYDQGIHVKTAGTTWLEELIGLAVSGNQALQLVKTIYAEGYQRIEELTKPYDEVIDIHPSSLPSPETFSTLSGEKIAGTLRHVPGNPDFNPDVRQLLHVSYKIAAEKGKEYLDMLEEHEEIIAQQVHNNLLNRHIKRLFE